MQDAFIFNNKHELIAVVFDPKLNKKAPNEFCVYGVSGGRYYDKFLARIVNNKSIPMFRKKNGGAEFLGYFTENTNKTPICLPKTSRGILVGQLAF